RLEPVALLDSLGDQGVRLRQERPLELRERRWRAGAPVGEDDAAALLARIGDVAHPGGEARLGRRVWGGATARRGSALPAGIGGGHARVLHRPEVERGAPMRAELADEPRASALAAEDDERLAEQAHALDAAARFDLAGLHDGNPVAAEEGAHHRAGTRPGE